MYIIDGWQYVFIGMCFCIWRDTERLCAVLNPAADAIITNIALQKKCYLEQGFKCAMMLCFDHYVLSDSDS